MIDHHPPTRCRSCGEIKQPEYFTLAGLIDRTCERCAQKGKGIIPRLANWARADLENFKSELQATIEEFRDDPIITLAFLAAVLLAAAVMSAPFLSMRY